jgi:alpha-D-xyloside xylohydrolase
MKTGNKILASLLLPVFVWVSTAQPLDAGNNSVVIPVKNYKSTNVKLVKVNVCTEGIVQVIASPVDPAAEIKSLMAEKNSWEKVDFNVDENSDETIITTKKLKILIDRSTGKIIFNDINCSTILAEGDRKISPAQVLGEKTFNIRQSFIWSKDEALYGLGQHQEGIMNWRGHYVELFQHNMRAVIPFLLSTKGYGIL